MANIIKRSLIDHVLYDPNALEEVIEFLPARELMIFLKHVVSEETPVGCKRAYKALLERRIARIETVEDRDGFVQVAMAVRNLWLVEKLLDHGKLDRASAEKLLSLIGLQFDPEARGLFERLIELTPALPEERRSIDARSYDKHTGVARALFIAVSRGNLEAVRFLAASPSARERITTLDWLGMRGMASLEIMRVIMHEEHLRANPLLAQAVREGHR